MTPHLNRLVETVQIRGHNIWFCTELTRRAPHVGANAWLQLILENSKSKKLRGITMLKKKLRITSSTSLGSPFDRKQLV